MLILHHLAFDIHLTLVSDISPHIFYSVQCVDCGVWCKCIKDRDGKLSLKHLGSYFFLEMVGIDPRTITKIPANSKFLNMHYNYASIICISDDFIFVT